MFSRSPETYRVPEYQPLRTTTFTEIGYQFPETTGLTMANSPVELLGRKQTEHGVAHMARLPGMDKVQLYALLTQIKPYPQSQGMGGSMADWRNPQFVAAHRAYNAPMWDNLQSHLADFLKIMDVARSMPAVWEVMAVELSRGGIFDILSGQTKEYPYYIDYTAQRVQGFHDAFVDRSPGSLLDTYMRYYQTHGYDRIVPILEIMESEGYIDNRPMTLNDNNSIELFNDGRGKTWRATPFLLRQISGNKRTPMYLTLYNAHEAMTRDFMCSLGDDPAQRALQLMHITYNHKMAKKRLHKVRFGNYLSISTSIFERINDTSVRHINRRWREQRDIDLADDPNMWFFQENEFKPKNIQPLICWETTPEGDRRYLFDHDEVETIFPGATGQPDRYSQPDTLAGFLGMVYTHPDMYSKFPPELPLPSVVDEFGNELSPGLTATGKPIKQAMQEGQVPFLAMHRAKHFMTEEVFGPLEKAYG